MDFDGIYYYRVEKRFEDPFILMRERKNKTVDIPDGRTKRIRALVFLALFFAAVTLVVLFIIWSRTFLFNHNPRLALREVRVTSSGYWNNRNRELAAISRLKMGTNIFDIDLKKLRDQIKTIPSIEDVRITRVLPDTLAIDVSERLPRALLNYPNSNWVIDENAVVMSRRQSMAVELKQLPVITGVPQSGVSGGKIMPELKPALDLIVSILGDFPNMRILLVSISTPEYLDFYIRYCNGKTYRVIMPVKNSGTAFMLGQLESAIIQASQQGEERTTYNLTFDGQVVIN